MPAKVDLAKCEGCGPCKEACPVDAIAIENDKATVDEDTCIDCGQCVDACPTVAITMD
jgi:NAD-dependent dihydropyrimidine dehydrogenase PreA subunit